MTTTPASHPVVDLTDRPVPCTSRARHDCTHTASHACHGDGHTVTWCPPRHADWLQDVADGVRCRDCGEPQAHWTVVTL